jgi:hypothetical protein
MIACNMELSFSDSYPVVQTDADYIETEGCVTRTYQDGSIEVWGEDISEHYLIRVRVDEPPSVDYVFLS